MVGSELPTPETRETTVRPRSCSRCATSPSTATQRGRLDQLGPGDATSQSSRRRRRAESTVPAPRAAARPRVVRRCTRGEIVGIAGVEGNGQTELVEAIIGLRDASGDRARSTASDLSQPGARSSAARRGIGYIPEDRQRDGLVLPFPLWENALLGHQGGATVRHGAGSSTAARPGDRTEQIVAELRRAHAGHRGARVHAVGRQPAEADRRARDDGRPDGARRRPPDPRRRRRRPGGRSGTSCATPAPQGWPRCSSRPTSRS